MIDAGGNCHNRRKVGNSSSKYFGVCYNSKNNIWRTYITANKTTYNLGYFDTEVAAARARDVKARELYGEFANLNFPSEL